MCSLFGTLRSKAAGRLTAAEIDRIRAVTSHLHRVLRIQEEQDALLTERDLLKGLFETTAVGLVLLDPSGDVLTANTRARSILERANVLTEREGRLHAIRRADEAQLQAAISHALDPWDRIVPGETVVLEAPVPGAAGPLRLLIMPAQPGRLQGPSVKSPAALVHILDPSAPLPTDQATLQKLFAFSRAEAQVAARLAAGLNVAEAAADLHVSEHTVRSHLKSLFSKTGTNQQSSLVSMLLRLQPPLAQTRQA